MIAFALLSLRDPSHPVSLPQNTQGQDFSSDYVGLLSQKSTNSRQISVSFKDSTPFEFVGRLVIGFLSEQNGRS